jgi:hypothetical protein
MRTGSSGEGRGSSISLPFYSCPFREKRKENKYLTCCIASEALIDSQLKQHVICSSLSLRFALLSSLLLSPFLCLSFIFRSVACRSVAKRRLCKQQPLLCSSRDIVETVFSVWFIPKYYKHCQSSSGVRVGGSSIERSDVK